MSKVPPFCAGRAGRFNTLVRSRRRFATFAASSLKLKGAAGSPRRSPSKVEARRIAANFAKLPICYERIERTPNELETRSFSIMAGCIGAVAQPGNVDYPVAIIIVAIMVAYVGLVYGPIGAFLAEYFPGRIRYTSVSVPYHIGNGWGGGLVPFITTAAYTATGSLAYALIYPIAVPAICLVLSLFLMPETHKMSIWEPETAKA